MPVERSTQASRSRTAREEIVQAALRLFAAEGYSATSMQDICRAAGVSKGGLYHHFGSKAAVLCSAVQLLADNRVLFPPFTGPPEQVPDGLDPIRIKNALVDIWAEAARDPALKEQIARAYASRATPEEGAGPLAVILETGALIRSAVEGSLRLESAVTQNAGRAA